jgi:hypothetical protein
VNRDFGRAPRWALAAIVAASLGFGAAQAAAAPALVRPAARHCDATKCDETCKRNIPGSTGVCVGGTSGHCDCLLGP